MEPFGGVAAIFDCDDSLILGSAGYHYFQYLAEHHIFLRERRTTALKLLAAIALRRLSYHDIIAESMALMGGIPVELARDCARVCYRQTIEPIINAEGRTRVAKHLSEGHLVVLASGSPSFIVHELAIDLRMHVSLGSEPHVAGGIIQPELKGEPCFAHGKLRAVQTALERFSVGLSSSFLYSDSSHDLPLFERVGRPVAVNPRQRFATVAKQKGFSIERWDAHLSESE